MELEKFDQLWKKIETLLARVEEHNSQKDRQNAVLVAKDEEIQRLKATISAMEQERASVKTKIDEMLTRIDRYVAE